MQTLFLTILILVGGVVQYILMAQAIKDLLRRPRVRGDNKVIWGLVILCAPFAGALIYTWMGPTSFLQRSALRSRPLPSQSTASAFKAVPQTRTQFSPPSNVTSIRAARSLRSQVRPAARVTPLAGRNHDRDRAHKVDSALLTSRKTGS
ncbi:MAG: PLDc N-terminal domain-containing protein [Thermomicrobiales bacterium]